MLLAEDWDNWRLTDGKVFSVGWLSLWNIYPGSLQYKFSICCYRISSIVRIPASVAEILFLDVLAVRYVSRNYYRPSVTCAVFTPPRTFVDESIGYLLTCLFRRKMLQDLLPANLIPMLEAEEWKQVTVAQFHQYWVRAYF